MHMLFEKWVYPDERAGAVELRAKIKELGISTFFKILCGFTQTKDPAVKCHS